MRRLAHVSDLHFGRIDERIVETLLDDLTAAAVDFVVVSGDLTQRARPQEYKAARAFLDRLPAPYLVVPGNHDVPTFELWERFTQPFRRYKKYITRDLSPLIVDEKIAILGLNTARPFMAHLEWAEGRVSRWQIDRVTSVFGEMSEDVFKILVTHHPFLPPPDEPGRRLVGRARLALEAVEQSGVDLLLAGHLHRGFLADTRSHHEWMQRSVLVAQASTATSTRLRAEPNAYNVLTIDPPFLTLNVRTWTGDAFETNVNRRFMKEAVHWREQ